MFGPLKYGILPQHLSQAELTGGNGMIQMGTYLAILTGTMLGGTLIAMKPAGDLLVSGTVVTIAVTGWLASRYIPKAEAPEPELKIKWNIILETIRIIGFARENRRVFWSIIAISWFWFIGATFLSLVPSYTRDVLNGNEQIATLLLAVFSVGIGSGSLLCEKLSGQRINTGLVPLGATGITIFAIDLFYVGVPEGIELIKSTILGPGELFALVEFKRALFDLFCIGMFGGFYIIPLYALVQFCSEEKHRARIIAANNILNALFMVFSALMTLALLTLGVPITVIFLVVAILNLGITACIFNLIPDFILEFLVWLRLKKIGDQ